MLEGQHPVEGAHRLESVSSRLVQTCMLVREEADNVTAQSVGVWCLAGLWL